MSNPLMQKGGQPASQQNQMTMQQAIAQIKSDPVGTVKQLGYNVPQDISNDPAAMIQYLVRSGQVPKSRLSQIASVFGRR